MSRKNNTYSNELKLEIVQAYLTSNESMQKIADRYDIRHVSQVKAWVKKFKEVESNPLKGKRTHFKTVEEERDYYKAQVEYLKKQYPNL